MRRLLYLLISAVILQSSLFAALTVTFPHTSPVDMYMGDTVVMLSFQVTATDGDRFTGLHLDNSSDLSFYKYGVERVELRTGTAVGGGALIAYKDFPSDISTPGLDLAFSNQPSTDGTQTYSIIYRVSAQAKKYTASGSTSMVYTRAYLTSLTTANGTVAISNSSAQASVVVRAAGLITLPDKSVPAFKPSAVISRGETVPMLEFTLRAEGMTANVNSIVISSSGNFATSATNRDERVRRVILLADSVGDGEYGGPSRDIIVCDMDLSQAHSGDRNTITLLLNPSVTLSPYANLGGEINSRVSQRTFWVLYVIGDGFPSNTELSCSLVGGNSGNLRGNFPEGNASTMVTGADAVLLSYTSPSTYNVVAGEKDIEMLRFTYDVKHIIRNTTIELQNGSGSFRFTTRDTGVNRACLYEIGAGGSRTLLGVANISTTESVSCVFNGITLESGTRTYAITYDTGIKMKKGQNIKAQVGNISAAGNTFATNGLAVWPPQADPFPVFPTILWVEFVHVHDGSGREISTIRPGDIFSVDIGVRNVMGINDGPINNNQVDLYIIDYTGPAFYTNDVGFYTSKLGGKEITSEFYIVPSYPTSKQISPLWSYTTTLSYDVTATNLKTSGPIYVDAKAAYNANYNSGFGTLPTVYYRAYYGDDGTLKPAAATRVSLGNEPTYATVTLYGSAETNLNSEINKNWIERMYLWNEDGYYRELSTGTRVDIPPNTRLAIKFHDDVLMDEGIVSLNGRILTMGTGQGDFYSYDPYDNVIELMLDADQYSGQGVLQVSVHEDGDLLHREYVNILTLYYSVINSNEKLKISNLLPYPSPYNPDNGSLNIGFDCNNAGAEYDVYIYDATGRIVFKETDLTTVLGYNNYSWDGKFDSGSTVGRGVYVARFHFRGSKKQDVITKFGVR